MYATHNTTLPITELRYGSDQPEPSYDTPWLFSWGRPDPATVLLVVCMWPARTARPTHPLKWKQ